MHSAFQSIIALLLKPSTKQKILIQEPFKFNQKYTIVDMLGAGGFGHIYSATRKSDGLLFACKFIRRDKVPSSRWVNDSSLGLVPMEVSAMHSVYHPSVVQFLEVLCEDGFIIIVQELFGSVWSSVPSTTTKISPLFNFGNGTSGNIHKSMDLFEFLDSHKLNMIETKYIVKQIVDVAEYVFANHNIIHGDIKDENILIDASLRIKLIDFGGASRLTMSDELNANQFHGTSEFASAEIIRGERYNGQKAEVWAIGCLAYGMVFSGIAFKDPKAIQYADPLIGKQCDDLLFMNLLRDCFMKNPDRRISLLELKNHAWFM